MQKLKINEIFYSLQGEGARAGSANIFIRLAGCNLKCTFCDTTHNSFKECSIDEITKELLQYNCKNIIWTGGEPTLQLDDGIINYFKNLGYYQSIETNGLNNIPNGIDYISVSPKNAKRSSVKYADEIRLVIGADASELPNTDELPNAKDYYLSPMFDGELLNEQNLKNCIRLVKENPQWKLSVQQHKIWNVQ